MGACNCYYHEEGGGATHIDACCDPEDTLLSFISSDEHSVMVGVKKEAMDKMMEQIIDRTRQNYIAALLANCGSDYVERKRLALQAALKLAEEV